MTATILTFGHIPKHHGGRQQSGLASAIWAIASNMPDRDGGFDVVFCATDVKSKLTRIDGLQVIGWTELSLLAGITRSPLRFLRLLAKLADLCRHYELPLIRTTFKAVHLNQAIVMLQPDYLHLHGCEAIVHLEAGIFDPTKTLVTLHGVHGDAGPANIRRMEERLNRMPVSFLAFVSHASAAEWRDVFGPPVAHVAVIPNAFDRSVFFLPKEGRGQKGGAKDHFRLVSVASINENKGQHRVVEAMIRLKQAGIDHEIDYTVIGSGPSPLIEDLLRRAAAAQLRIRHLPYLSPPDLRAQLAQADFMILPSGKEGFGIVFLESIACGVPVVLPKDLPICEEPGLISDANSVLLESSSVEAILTFLADLPSHRFVGEKVAATLPEYSWQSVAARYRSLLVSEALPRNMPRSDE